MVDVERSLWRAVLAQAFDDAEMVRNEEGVVASPFQARQARLYLRADDPKEVENLETVCGYAEIPSDRLIFWARGRYEVPQPVRRRKRRSAVPAAEVSAPNAIDTPEMIVCPPQEAAALPLAVAT